MTDSMASALGELEEVEIVTRASAEAPVHRTTIWVVAVNGRLFARTYRGPSSRWYREALAQPACELEATSRSYPMTVRPVTEGEVWQEVSEAYRTKYAGDPSTPAMLRAEVLPTTIEFRPR